MEVRALKFYFKSIENSQSENTYIFVLRLLLLEARCLCPRGQYFREDKLHVFELCRRTQLPSLTFRLVGGSTFGLWPLFHLRDGRKWTEMTATQNGGTLRD
jgi:hypothetical protein